MSYTIKEKKMKTVLRNILAIIVLAAIVYFVTNYAGLLQQQVGVKGASTSRAKDIAGKIGSDVGSQVGSAEQQLMNMKISGIINGLSRFQRVPQDINSIKSFAQDQITNVLESRNRKK
jgi:TolA-binding protein